MVQISLQNMIPVGKWFSSGGLGTNGSKSTLVTYVLRVE